MGPLVSGRVCNSPSWCNNIVSDKNTMTGQEGERTRKPLQGRVEKLLYLSNFHFSFLPLFGRGPHSFILHEAPQALYLTLHCLGAVGRVLDEQAPESSGPVGASGGQWGRAQCDLVHFQLEELTNCQVLLLWSRRAAVKFPRGVPPPIELTTKQRMVCSFPNSRQASLNRARY